jgi:hypothetical protein
MESIFTTSPGALTCAWLNGPSEEHLTGWRGETKPARCPLSPIRQSRTAQL